MCAMTTEKTYQAILSAPFGVLGICCENDVLTGINFLDSDTLPQSPLGQFTQLVCDQLISYFENPDFQFNLPYCLRGTSHQSKVWKAMIAIPRGETLQYGELAQELSSSPRAVGQACGANPVPIIIPCHRVVGKTSMGGFAHQRDGYKLAIKRWLLTHEQR